MLRRGPGPEPEAEGLGNRPPKIETEKLKQKKEELDKLAAKLAEEETLKEETKKRLTSMRRGWKNKLELGRQVLQFGETVKSRRAWKFSIKTSPKGIGHEIWIW